MNDIDILMAAYNSEKYIAEQIDSILNQTYTSYHLYIYDDLSTDNTLDILSKTQNVGIVDPNCEIKVIKEN